MYRVHLWMHECVNLPLNSLNPYMILFLVQFRLQSGSKVLLQRHFSALNFCDIPVEVNEMGYEDRN